MDSGVSVAGNRDRGFNGLRTDEDGYEVQGSSITFSLVCDCAGAVGAARHGED